MARKSSKRGIAAALALSCLLGPILAHAHLWLVQHARCEHGELLHVGAPGSDDGVAVAGDPLPAPAPTPAADGQSIVLSESHEHDHCVIASARKAQARAGSEGPCLAPPSPTVPSPRLLRAPPPSPLARYVLAPKNSPPA